ncbi:hypothetical protein, partial [Hydrogenimonas sp.]
MKSRALFFLLSLCLLGPATLVAQEKAATTLERNAKRVQEQMAALQKQKSEEERKRKAEAQAARLRASLEEIDRRLNEESVWQKIYANHMTYVEIAEQMRELEKKIKRYKKLGARKYRSKIQELEARKVQLEERLTLLKDYAQNPFKTLIKPKEIDQVPSVTNPVAIIGAFSHIKQLGEQLTRFEQEILNLEHFIAMLENKLTMLKELKELHPDDEKL